MFQRLLILLPLIFGLMMFSCSLQEPEQTKTVELTFEDIATQDVQAAQKEVQNVVTMTMNFSLEALATHEELLNLQQNGSSLAKGAGDWVYSWDGKYHLWQRSLIDGAFSADFLKKIYYADASGNLLEASADAYYMFSENRATGAFGFQGEAPANEYGVRFHHQLNSTWTNMQSSESIMSADGRYQKTNKLIYNGKDALLKYIVNLNVSEVTFIRNADSNQINVKGSITIEMKPWNVRVDCDGSHRALVTIYEGKRIFKTFEYDLNEANLTDFKYMM